MSVSDIQMRNEDGEFQSIFPITIAQGGTGATNASAARTALGITLKELGASDYVVAQGTSGAWFYIKYKNGYAEAYTGIDTTGYFDNWAFNKMWGYTYLAGPGKNVEYQPTPKIALPFTFKEVYEWGVNVSNGNAYTSGYGVTTGDAANIAAGDENITEFPQFFLCRQSKDDTTTNLRIRRFVRGRWK